MCMIAKKHLKVLNKVLCKWVDVACSRKHFEYSEEKSIVSFSPFSGLLHYICSVLCCLFLATEKQHTS